MYSFYRKPEKGVLKSINYKDPIVKYRGNKVLRLVSILTDKKNTGIDQYTAIDVFYTFYLPYPLLEDEDRIPRSLKKTYVLVKSMLKAPQIHELRSRTVADNLMSSVAASILLAEVWESIEKAMEESYRTSFSTTARDSIEEKIKEELIRREVEKKLSSITKDLDNVKKLRNLIEGRQPGSVSMMAYEEYAPQLIKLARNTEVKKILELLSGVKPWTMRIPKRRTRYKHGEIIGYELGKDIERLARSSLALPDELFYLKFLEGKLLLYQKVLSQSYGPLYCLLDKSGSMDGLKMIWAKAVALSLYMRAVKEHREFYFRFFDSIPYPLARVDRRPKAKQVLKLIEYVARVKGSGGTDISRAIILATNDIRSGVVKDVSDIVLITDGVDRIAEQLVSYNLRRANARLITVMVLGDNKSLKRISTKYFTVTKLSREDMLQVVEA